MNTLEVLNKCTIIDNTVKLPEGQLDRKTYLDVKKKLEGIGGKWKGGKTQGFVFPSDPTDRLEEIQGGKKVNLKKDFQFFETPPEIAQELVSRAYIKSLQKNHYVLEPSAGRGAIIDAILEASPGVTVHYCELMPDNLAYLKQKYADKPNVIHVGDDFLKIGNERKYDAIVANPPFAKNQDIAHFRKMCFLVDKTSHIACITSMHWQYSSTGKAKEFGDMLKSIGAKVHNLKEGSFKVSGTNVLTCMITLTK